jgi:hypothetical protein
MLRDLSAKKSHLSIRPSNGDLVTVVRVCIVCTRNRFAQDTLRSLRCNIVKSEMHIALALFNLAIDTLTNISSCTICFMLAIFHDGLAIINFSYLAAILLAVTNLLFHLLKDHLYLVLHAIVQG